MILAHKTSQELLERAGKEQLAAEILRETVRPLGIDDRRGAEGRAGRAAVDGSLTTRCPSKKTKAAAQARRTTRCATCTSPTSSSSEREPHDPAGARR